MIGNPMERRKAERFAELLEATEGGRRRHNRTSNDDELSSMVELGESMQALKSEQAATAPDPGFQAQLRQRLMAIASVEGVGATAASDHTDEAAELKPSPHPVQVARNLLGGRRVAVAAAILVGALGVSGVSSASGAAVPGDTLYPIKRSTEQAQLAFAGSDSDRGELHLEFATARLAEASNLSERPAEFREALSQMDAAILNGVAALNTAAASEGESRDLNKVTAFIAETQPQVSELAEKTTGAARESVSSSLATLDAARERTTELKSSMACVTDADLKVDELGPVPVDCAALPGSGQGEKVPPQTESTTQEKDVSPSSESEASKEPSPTPEGPNQSAEPGDAEESDDPDQDEGSGGLLDGLTDLFSGWGRD